MNYKKIRLNNMEKRIKVYIWLMIIAAFSSITFLIYENRIYQKQIADRDKLIGQILIKDSISSRLLNIKETDSLIIVTYEKGEDGHALTYDELSEQMHFYRKQAELKDFILVKAKQRYKFNYSFKERGDTLIIGFWKK